MKYPVYQPSLTGNEKKYVDECLDTGWISSKGHFVSDFENAFSQYIGVKHGCGVCNGTVAIHLAASALGLGNSDEIICPTFTYIASANPFEQLGCKVVFCDSLSDSWQMDPADVEGKITPKTKALMVVHLYGHPADMDALCTIAKKHGLFLIEDCAEAIGTRYKGQPVGSFGDIACFSFFGNKTITCGEGGMVCCNNNELAERVRHLKGQGVVSWREYWHDVSAYNYRMTNIQAAIGLAQFEQIDKFITAKRQIAEWYMQELKNTPLIFHKPDGDVFHTFWMISALARNTKERDALRNHLKQSDIETRPTFSCIHQMPVYNKSFQYFPVAEDLSARGLNLPSYPALNEADIKAICLEIKRFYGK